MARQPKVNKAASAQDPDAGATPEGEIVVIGRVTGEMRSFGEGVVARKLDAGVLEQNLKGFLNTMTRVIGELQGRLENYQLDSISLKAEVSASGSVSLLGTGGTVKGGGGLEFTFTRIEKS